MNNYSYGYPFKFDTRQYWVNFDQPNKEITHMLEFLDYLPNIKPSDFTYISFGSNRQVIRNNYQILPYFISSYLDSLDSHLDTEEFDDRFAAEWAAKWGNDEEDNLSDTNDNSKFIDINIINIDPEFNLEEIKNYFNTTFKISIVYSSISILHFSIDRVNMIFSKSKAPTYDMVGYNKVCNIIDKVESIFKCNTVQSDLIAQFKPNELTRNIVDKYWSSINNIIDNANNVLIVNYIIYKNQKYDGKNYCSIPEILNLDAINRENVILAEYMFYENTSNTIAKITNGEKEKIQKILILDSRYILDEDDNNNVFIYMYDYDSQVMKLINLSE